ncbi:MAG: DMT family transporter [Bryobacteraceae bacterium]|nr:DMT family transporter [Bryobacteraceae bacterium]
MNRGELGLALVCLFWGATFVMVKSALDDVSTVLFLALRFSIATVLLFGVFRLRGRRLTSHGVWAGLLVGSLLYAGYLLQTIGLKYTTPATSGFITGLYIPFVPVLQAIVFRRMPGMMEWLGILAATVGMGLLTLQSASFSIGLGELLTVGCAFAFAWHILALGHFSRKMDTDWLTLLQIAACSAISLSSFWWVETPAVRWPPAVLSALAVTSVLATAVAFWIQTWAQARTSPTRAVLIFSLEPVFAWGTSWLFLGEVLTARALAGAVCILAGILLVELKPAR